MDQSTSQMVKIEGISFSEGEKFSVRKMLAKKQDAP